MIASLICQASGEVSPCGLGNPHYQLLTLILSQSVRCASEKDCSPTIPLPVPILVPVTMLLMTSCSQDRLKQLVYVFVHALAYFQTVVSVIITEHLRQPT